MNAYVCHYPKSQWMHPWVKTRSIHAESDLPSQTREFAKESIKEVYYEKYKVYDDFVFGHFPVNRLSFQPW